MKTRVRYNLLTGVVGLVLVLSCVLAVPTASRADLTTFPYFDTAPDSKAVFPASKAFIETLVTVYEADRVNEKATGADMKGMTVTAHFEGGSSESLRWDLLGGGFAGVSSASDAWSLRVDAAFDTWYPGYGFKNYYGIWELVNNTGSNLLRLELDGTTADPDEDELPVFFDLAEPLNAPTMHYGGTPTGTFGSWQGGTFVPLGPGMPAGWDWVETKMPVSSWTTWNVDARARYSLPVWNPEHVGDMPGDLWANVAIEFGSLSGTTWTEGALGSSDVTYRFGLDTDVVPVPSAFLLGTLGLSLAGWKLRRREELLEN